MVKVKRVCNFHKHKKTGIPIETKFIKNEEFCPECKKEGVNYGIRTAIYSEDPPLEK